MIITAAHKLYIVLSVIFGAPREPQRGCDTYIHIAAEVSITKNS